MGKNLLQHIYRPSKCLAEAEIKGYLAGSIKAEGKRRVENHLLDCPLCSDAVEGFEQLGATHPQFHLLEDFSTLTQKLAPQEGGKIRRLTPGKVLLRAAAAVVILLVSYFTLLQSPSGDQLYSQFYSSYQNDIPLDMRNGGEVSTLNPVFEGALKHYASGRFAESLPLFEEALRSEADSDAIRFYAGMAALETNQFEKASGFFASFKNHQGGYAQKAHWYQALVAIKLGDKETAKNILDGLIAKGSFNEAQAIKLRSKL